MDRGAWRATVHRVTRSRTWLSMITHAPYTLTGPSELNLSSSLTWTTARVSHLGSCSCPSPHTFFSAADEDFKPNLYCNFLLNLAGKESKLLPCQLHLQHGPIYLPSLGSLCLNHTGLHSVLGHDEHLQNSGPLHMPHPLLEHASQHLACRAQAPGPHKGLPWPAF